MSMDHRERPVGDRTRLDRIVALGLVAVTTVLLAACTEDGLVRGSLVVEGAHDLASGSGHVLVLGGTARVPEGSSIGGSLVLLGDALVVEGMIAGDVLLFGGAAVLGPGAVLDGALVVAGGDVRVDPAAVVRGGIRQDLDLLAEWTRPAPTMWERFTTFAIQSLLLAAFAWLVAAAAPGAVRRMSEAVAEHAAVAGAMGVLAALVATVLLVIMAFTVVLIPVTLVAAVVLTIAIGLGWIAIGRGLALRFARSRGRARVGPRDVAVWTIAVMAMLTVTDWIPIVGPIVALVVTVTGFGAVLITGFGTRRFVPETGVGADPGRMGGDGPPGREG